MASVTSLVMSVLRPSMKELLGGEKFVPFDAVDKCVSKKMSAILKNIVVDMGETRTGDFLEAHLPGIVKPRRRKPSRRSSKRSHESSPPATPITAPEKEELNHVSTSSKVSSAVLDQDVNMRSAKPPSMSKPATPAHEAPKRLSLRSAPISLRSEPSPIKGVSKRRRTSHEGGAKKTSRVEETKKGTRDTGFRSSPAVSDADGVKSSLQGASSSTSPHTRRRYGSSSALASKFTELKKKAQSLWEAKDYDQYETVSREAVVACFDWALAREEDMRKREAEIRHTPEKLKFQKNELRKHYHYMKKRFVPERIEQLTSIGRKSLVPFFQGVISKVYFRMHLLEHLWADEEKQLVSLKQKIDTALASDKVGDSFSKSDLSRMLAILNDYENFNRIADGVCSENGSGVQEPGAEGYVQ